MEPIVTLTGTQLQAFLAYMQDAVDSNTLTTIRIAIDEGGVKLKFNHHTWTRALGEVTGTNNG